LPWNDGARGVSTLAPFPIGPLTNRAAAHFRRCRQLWRWPGISPGRPGICNAIIGRSTGTTDSPRRTAGHLQRLCSLLSSCLVDVCPGSQILIYAAMRLADSFDIVSFRTAWAAVEFVTMVAWGLAAYWWLGLVGSCRRHVAGDDLLAAELSSTRSRMGRWPAITDGPIRSGTFRRLSPLSDSVSSPLTRRCRVDRRRSARRFWRSLGRRRMARAREPERLGGRGDPPRDAALSHGDCPGVASGSPRLVHRRWIRMCSDASHGDVRMARKHWERSFAIIS